jgi:hypothetical protein
MVAEAVKRRKKTSEPASQIDGLLIEVWEQRFAELTGQIAELTRSLRGFNGTPGVMERLVGIETMVREINGKVEKQQPVKEPVTASAPAQESPSKDKPLTKSQLAVMALEFLKPVATAVIIWALLTFFPGVMAHVFPGK